jgi:TetR/AcrR family transcriptional regulator
MRTAMSERESKPGRSRDAEKTREAILNAAEAVFAEYGFGRARIDAIAQVADYNKSLIGQYFGDKLGLYAEVLKRADRELDALLAHGLSPLESSGNKVYKVREDMIDCGG